MGKSLPRWSFADTCRMEEFIKAGKTWQRVVRHFPDRTSNSVEAKFYSVKVNGARRPRDEPGKHLRRTVARQDSAFQDAMTRAHSELTRQASAAPPERKRA